MGRLLFFQSKEKPSFPLTWDERFRVATQIILPSKLLTKVISQIIIKDTTLSALHRLCVGKQFPTGKRTDFLSSPALTKRRLSEQASEILFFLSLLHYLIMDYYITFFTFFQFFFINVNLFQNYAISKLSIFLAISTAFFSSSPRAINASPLIISLI